MIPTHYEKYMAKCNKYRTDMKRLILQYKKMWPGHEPTYLLRFMEDGLSKPGIEIWLPDATQAFSIELLNEFFLVGTESDEPLSLSRALLCSQLPLFKGVTEKMIGKANSQTIVEIAYQVLSHERAGKKVYEVSDALSEKLLHTELRGLKAEDLMLPYSNIYISIPKSTGLKIYNAQTGWHEVVGIYITEDKQGKQESARQKFISTPKGTHLEDGRTHADLVSVREWTMLVVGAAGKDANGKEIPDDDALYYFRMYFPEGRSLDEIIEEVSRYHTKLSGSGTATENTEVLNAMDSEWMSIFRWVMNVIVYATYTDPGEEVYGNPEARKLWQRVSQLPSGSRKRRNLIKKGSNVDPRKRYFLGKNITVSRHAAEAPGIGVGKGSPLTVRTRVTGHWRRVPYGVKRAERRLTWIEPFWRGPEAADVVSHRHVLK